MSPDPSRPDKTMAERRRDLMYLDRAKTLKRFEGSEWGRAKLAEMGRLLKPGMSPLETVDRQLELLWERTLEAAAQVKMPVVARPVDGLEVVFLPREEMAASCESFSDGSGLVSVSDTLLSMVWRLATLNSTCRAGRWGGSRSGRRRRDDVLSFEALAASPGLMAGTAALRYTTQHLRVWGMSAAIGTRRTRGGLRDGALAPMFVIAHEIGHFAMGHDHAAANGKSPVEREFEADEFALRALLGHLGPLQQTVVGASAVIALSAIRMWESAVLLRDVRVHPPVLERWQALGRMLGGSAIKSEDHTYAARAMTAAASASGSLPASFWEAMRADRSFETPHGRAYQGQIQAYDATESFTMERRAGLIADVAPVSPGFAEGWHALCSDGWEAGCEAWRIDSAGFLDRSRPLSYLQVVNRIAAAPIWGDVGDGDRRGFALLAIHARPEELRALS